MQSLTYDIDKPWKTLDPWQKKYIATEGNCFLLCGRQSGKSAAASIKFGKRAAKYKNRKIYMLAYTEKQAYNLFFKTLMYLKAKHPKMLITKGSQKPTKHIINLTNRSQIFCYAVGLAGEGIRGPTATDLVIDEAAPMAREVFVALSPMLSVTKGNLDVLSTPRGKIDKDGKEKYFYQCSKDDSFTKFYVSAEDCPRHSKEFLAKEKKRMSALEYAQEYLAMFLDDLHQVFSDKLIAKVTVLKRSGTLQNKKYYLGVDIARMGNDESTFEIIDGTDRKNLLQVENQITKKTLTTETTKRIIQLNNIYDFKQIFVDDGGMGVGVFDQLLDTDETKRKTVAINNMARPLDREEKQKKRIMKEDLYNNMLALMERGEIKLLDDPEIRQSLKSVQFEIKHDRVKYCGNYTHIAEGLIRAAWCVKDKSLNPFIY